MGVSFLQVVGYLMWSEASHQVYWLCGLMGRALVKANFSCCLCPSWTTWYEQQYDLRVTATMLGLGVFLRKELAYRCRALTFVVSALNNLALVTSGICDHGFNRTVEDTEVLNCLSPQGLA